VVILNRLLQHLDDDLALDGFTLVDGEPAVILEKIRKFELGHPQHVGFEGTAN